MAQFEVGKDVVCIEEHANSPAVKYDVYPLLAIRNNKCQLCNKGKVNLFLDVGLRHTKKKFTIYCKIHGDLVTEIDNIFWHPIKMFAPLDDICNIDELQEVLESEIVEIC